MKKINRLLLILLCIALVLGMATGCQSKAPIEDDSNLVESGETPDIDLDGEKLDDKELPEDGKDIENPDDSSGNSSPDTPVSSTADRNEAKSEDTKQSKANEGVQLKVQGAGIEKEVSFTLDELKAMKDSYFEDDFYSLNSYGTRQHFHFAGIKVKAILDKAGVKSSAKNVKFVAEDGYTQELTLEGALKEDYIDEENPEKKFPVIIAWHENGKDYDIKKGPPFRLVVGQKEPDDMNKPQWVMNIDKIIID